MSHDTPVCPCCNSSRITHRWHDLRIRGERQIPWCADCGYGWLYPIPSDEELRKYYASGYVLNTEKEKDALVQERIQRLNNFLPDRGKLIDIGSGMGQFLQEARQNKYNVTGIEPGMEAASFCRDRFKIDVFESIDCLEDAEPESFDAVTLWDVWEHVPEPVRFMNQCIQLLRKGGVLAVSTSNASSLAARIFRGKWRYVMAGHLSYFTYPFAMKIIRKSEMILLYEEHTIKIHCFIEGFLSWLPVKINSGDLLRMGQLDESGENDFSGDNVGVYSEKNRSIYSGFLQNVRKIIFRINRTPFPLPIGDMMELYFRK